MCGNYFQRRKVQRPQALRGPRPFGNSLARSSRCGLLAPRRCRRVRRLGETVPQVLLRILFCFVARSGTCSVTGAAEQTSTIAAVEIKHSSSLFLRGRGCVRRVFTRGQRASVVKSDRCGCSNAATATVLEKCRTGHGREPRTFFPALTGSPKAAL